QIENISIERITNEFTKLFAGSYLTNGIDYLKSLQIYKHLPIMVEYTYIIDKLPKTLKPLCSFGEVIALFHYVETDIPITIWAKAWKCSNKTKQESVQLVQALHYYQKSGLDEWLVYQLDTAYYDGFSRLISIFFSDDLVLTPKTMYRMKQNLPIHSKKDLALKGHDLLELFPYAEKGPWLQEVISRMERAVVFGIGMNNMQSTRNKLIHLLATSKDKYTSGQMLSEKLHISRSAIWKHMKELEKDGYTIEGKSNQGYRMISFPQKLSENTVQWGLKT